MGNKRDSFIFYRSFYESMKGLKPEEKAMLFDAICELSLNFNDIELDGFPKSLFILIKPQIEANNKRYENGKAPKRSKREPKTDQKTAEKSPKQKQQKSKTEAKQKQTRSKSTANENVNVNVNDNVNVNGKINFSDLENTQWFETIIRYLQFRIDMDQLLEYWNQFQTAMIADDDLYRDKDDYRSHFRNWVKIQIDNKEKNEKIGRNTGKGFKSNSTQRAIESLQKRIEQEG